MNLEGYAALIRQMRQAQNDYFRERSPQLLSRAKELERRVDDVTAEVLDKQGTLFNRKA